MVFIKKKKNWKCFLGKQERKKNYSCTSNFHHSHDKPKTPHYVHQHIDGWRHYCAKKIQTDKKKVMGMFFKMFKKKIGKKDQIFKLFKKKYLFKWHRKTWVFLVAEGMSR